MLSRAIEARCLGHPTSLMIEMTSMMFSGVFDRFPSLRFSFMEGGVAWALFTMERMQEAYRSTWSPSRCTACGRISSSSSQWKKMRPLVRCSRGDHVLLYASDYPHLPPARVLKTLAAFE